MQGEKGQAGPLRSDPFGFAVPREILLNRTRLFASILVAAFSLILASCGGGGSTSPVTSGNANVRFINGSPDAGAFDVLVNGKVVASDVVYGQITAYQSLAVGTSPLPQVAFVKTGTQVNIFPPLSGNTAQTFQLGAGAGTNLTVVVEGEASYPGNTARALTLGAFIEPTISNATGSYSVVFHHASPLAALASANGLNVGEILFGATNTFYVLGNITFANTTGLTTSLFGVQSQAAITGPPGVGFYVGPETVATATPVPVTPTPTPTPTPTATATAPVAVPAPTIYAAIMPGPAVLQSAIESSPTNPFTVTGVDSNNTNQSLPFNSDTNLFIYVIDSTSAPQGVTLVGTFSN